MPMIKKGKDAMHFPYTKKGMASAKKMSKKMGISMKVTKKVKKTKKK
jgi:hypothetical protein